MMLLIATGDDFVTGRRRVKSSEMWPRRCGVLPVAVLLVAVAASLVAGQHQHGRGQRVRGQRVVHGRTRQETYRTSYTRETARHRADELVPEVVNIKIERQEQTRTYLNNSSPLRNQGRGGGGRLQCQGGAEIGQTIGVARSFPGGALFILQKLDDLFSRRPQNRLKLLHYHSHRPDPPNFLKKLRLLLCLGGSTYNFLL